ncbi:CatB-related O-acetyltransferase [Aliarcobacter butzleri]|uniref:CatB-related O-acetyltransferase n=1 Tax=Aliarcobacter butzleri TaxID=28197 RepID=UPI003B228F17
MFSLCKFILKKLFLKIKFNIKIDLTTNIRKDIKLEHKVNIGSYCNINCKSIGKYTFIGNNTIIDSSTMTIGRFCSISSGVKIGLRAHPQFFISTHPFCYAKRYGFTKDKFSEIEYSGYTYIGNDVLISANTIILAGVRIGNGAIVGAGSVVTKDVEPYSVVAGVPAKLIKYRFDKKNIEKLLEIKWWDIDENKLRKNIDLFESIGDIDRLNK